MHRLTFVLFALALLIAPIANAETYIYSNTSASGDSSATIHIEQYTSDSNSHTSVMVNGQTIVIPPTPTPLPLPSVQPQSGSVAAPTARSIIDASRSGHSEIMKIEQH